MNFVRKWIAQIQAQLSQLSVSQKMLIATLLVVVPMSLWIVYQYAAAPMMAPVLDQPIDAARKAQIISYLEGRGIAYDTVGDRIRVPAEKRLDVLAGLQLSELLPEDTSRGFDALIEKQTWWQSSEQNRQLYLIAKQNVLAQVVRKYPGVRDATVLISMPQQTGFGATHQRPSASVNVVTTTPLDQKKVDAIAGLVSGAVAEMEPTGVAVIDATTGRQWKVRPTGDMVGGDYLEQIHAQERYYHDKVSSALQYIRNVIVAVNVEIDLTSKRTETTSFDREKSVELLTTEENRSTRTTEPPAGGEPGVRANAGADINAAAAQGRTSTTEETRTSFAPSAGKVFEQAATPGGAPSRISASVSVPRSFFVALYKQGKAADAPEPKEEDLKPLIEDHLQRIRKQIEPLVLSKQAGTVAVDMYPDGGPMMGLNLDGSQTAGASVLLASGYAKPLGLGLLAALSLTMMLMMVRKAGQRPMTPTVQELAGVPPPVPTDEELIGEAEEAEPTLPGMELSEDAIRHRKLAEQVQEMVKANPAEVATLMRRWMRKDDE